MHLLSIKQHPLNNTACPISALLNFLLSSQYIKPSDSYKLSISKCLILNTGEHSDPTHQKTDVNWFTAAFFFVDFFYEVVNKLLLMYYYKLVCSTWLWSIFSLKISLKGEPFTSY